VKSEEDIDFLGNKGGFKANQDFTLLILIGWNESSIEKIIS